MNPLILFAGSIIMSIIGDVINDIAFVAGGGILLFIAFAVVAERIYEEIINAK